MDLNRRDFGKMLAAAVGGVIAGAAAKPALAGDHPKGDHPTGGGGGGKHACKGMNACKGKGGCAVPIKH